MGIDKHTVLAVIFLIFLAFIVGVAVFIWRKSGKEGDTHEIKKRIYGIQPGYFVVILAVLIILLAFTLNTLPYPNDRKGTVDFTVSVVGRQWAWSIAQGTINKNGLNFTSQDSLVIPVRKMIDFQVTSGDVNHSFGLYDSQGQLLAETQAMPGYVNDLKFRFSKPGTYHVVCLEYCGLAHQLMDSEISVK